MSHLRSGTVRGLAARGLAARGLAARGVAALGLWLASWPLLGFSASAMFETDTQLGGGGGLTYVGSPTSHDLGCAHCHQGSQATSGLWLDSEPPGLFQTGYAPGAVYAITVRLHPERRGTLRNGACAEGKGGCNRNGFVAELLGPDAKPAGTLCSDSGTLDEAGCSVDAGKETLLFGGGRAVGGVSLQQPTLCSEPAAATGPEPCVDLTGKSQPEAEAAVKAAVRGRTRWLFRWRAPEVATAVSFHLGLVDGDGGTQVTPDHNDYFGDDVYAVHQTLWAQGTEPPQEAACRAGRTASLGPIGLALMAAALLAGVLLVRSRRRSGRDTGRQRVLPGPQLARAKQLDPSWLRASPLIRIGELGDPGTSKRADSEFLSLGPQRDS